MPDGQFIPATCWWRSERRPLLVNECVVVGFDTEGWPFERALCAVPLVCVQDAAPGERGRITLIQHALPIIEKYLESNTILAIHNAQHDVACMIAEFPHLAQAFLAKYARGEIHCTIVRQKLLDCALGLLKDEEQGGKREKYGLDAVAAKFGSSKNAEDPWRLRFPELYGVPVELWPAEPVHYAQHDPEEHLTVWFGQEDCCKDWERLKGSSILHETGEQSESAFNLHLAQCWGVRTHRERTELLRIKTKKQLAEWHVELQREGLIRTISDTGRKHARKRAMAKGVAEAVTLVLHDVELTDFLTAEEREKYAHKKESKDEAARTRRMWSATAHDPRLRKLTKTGEAKAKERAEERGLKRPTDAQLWAQLTAAEQLEYLCCDYDACVLSGDETLIKLSEYGSADNVLSGANDLAEGYDLPLQAGFDSLKATGRTSSFKPKKGPLKAKQLQNFSQKGGARECVIPRPGNGFIQADVPGAELHTHAQNCWELLGASALADQLRRGIDPHLKLGARTIGIAYEDALARSKEKAIKDARGRSKPANFGFPGGMYPKKFVLYSRAQWETIFTLEEAEVIRAQWLTEYPENEPYFEWAKQQWKSGAIRQFMSGRWRGGATLNAVKNGFFQGRSSDAIKRALRVMTRETFDPESPMFGFHLVNMVHDETIFEGPLERCSAAAKRMAEILWREYNVYVPDVPLKREKVLPVVMLAWSKDAETIWADGVEGGEILPWDLQEAA